MSKERADAGMDRSSATMTARGPGIAVGDDIESGETDSTRLVDVVPVAMGLARTRRGRIGVGANEPGIGEAEHVVTAQLKQAVEAILLSTERVVSASRLAMALGELGAAVGSPAEVSADRPSDSQGDARTKASTRTVRAAIDALNAEYAATGRTFRIQALAGGYRFMTIPEMAPVLRAFHGARERASLSRAALESLAIIAYKQPMTRARLEAIRGVACGEILRSLTDRRLVTIVGRAEELGRPLLYGTTKQFLEAFGLASMKDLPTVEEFRARAATGTGGQDDED